MFRSADFLFEEQGSVMHCLYLKAAVAAALFAILAGCGDDPTALCKKPEVIQLFDKGFFVAMLNVEDPKVNGEGPPVDAEKAKALGSAWERWAIMENALQLAQRQGTDLYNFDKAQKDSLKRETAVLGGRGTTEPGVYICMVRYKFGGEVAQAENKGPEFSFAHRWKLEMLGEQFRILPIK